MTGRYICKKCIGYQKTRPQRCIVCEKNSIDGFVHFKCRKKYSLDGVVSIWAYEAVVRRSLISLKYKFAWEIANELAAASSIYLKENFTALPKEAVMCVVPLFKKRENWRGFNQATKIGQLLAKNLGWEFMPDLVVRRIQTTPQVDLARVDRKKNLSGAFEFNKKYLPLVADNLSLIIFDDVCTTGTTLKEVGKVLKRSGFEKVWGLTVAR